MVFVHLFSEELEKTYTHTHTHENLPNLTQGWEGATAQSYSSPYNYIYYSIILLKAKSQSYLIHKKERNIFNLVLLDERCVLFT